MLRARVMKRSRVTSHEEVTSHAERDDGWHVENCTQLNSRCRVLPRAQRRASHKISRTHTKSITQSHTCHHWLCLKNCEYTPHGVLAPPTACNWPLRGAVLARWSRHFLSSERRELKSSRACVLRLCTAMHAAGLVLPNLRMRMISVAATCFVEGGEGRVPTTQSLLKFGQQEMDRHEAECSDDRGRS